MLLDHPQVILRREGRQALRHQVVAAKPGRTLTRSPDWPSVLDRLGEDELNVAVLGPAGMVLAPLDPGCRGGPAGAAFVLPASPPFEEPWPWPRWSQAWLWVSWSRSSWPWLSFPIFNHKGDDKAPSLPLKSSGWGGAAPIQNHPSVSARDDFPTFLISPPSFYQAVHLCARPRPQCSVRASSVDVFARSHQAICLRLAASERDIVFLGLVMGASRRVFR